MENIEYDILVQNERLDRDRLDELVELMVDTVCSHREMIRIAGDDYPAEVVKSRFLKLNSSHIEYVLDRMRENTTYVRNIKKYLLAALYNAPATIDSYYTSLVSHDMPEDAERKGLGTPATRAAILEKLVAAGFVERRGKSLIPTKAGINLVTVLPDTLTSPMLTAEWEQKLTAIARGEGDPAAFMAGISEMTRELVKTYSHISEEGQKLFAPEQETVGLCPRCGKPVYEGKKNFYCSDRSCRFVLWKDDRFWTSRKKELTRKMAADLLKKGRTSVRGMWSEKKGAAYDAVVVLDDTGEKYVRFKMEFPKSRKQ